MQNVRTETSVKLRVISCPPVVEVLIRRPDPKYQLGFSVQNGVVRFRFQLLNLKEKLEISRKFWKSRIFRRINFGISSVQICSLLRGGIAERGGVRVGHRIIEIGGQSVVAVSHDKIVQKLSSAVGEVRSEINLIESLV